MKILVVLFPSYKRFLEFMETCAASTIQRIPLMHKALRSVAGSKFLDFDSDVCQVFILQASPRVET